MILILIGLSLIILEYSGCRWTILNDDQSLDNHHRARWVKYDQCEITWVIIDYQQKLVMYVDNLEQ